LRGGYDAAEPWRLPSFASGKEIHEELMINNFEMFEPGSQDFCAKTGPEKSLGFIGFCAVQHVFNLTQGNRLAGAPTSWRI
jgi:hypothetical protein